MIKNKIIVTLAIAILVGCTTNPITGRKQLSLVSNDSLFPQAFQQYTEVIGTSKIEKSSKDATIVKTVGARIKAAAERYYKSIGKEDVLANYQWEFNLIDSEQLNAWCMPGGKVAFYTGILPVCKDATGVAIVMGHEISHALAGHGAEQASQQQLASYGALIGGIATAGNQQAKGVFDQLYPMGAQLTLLKYGRNQESEADEMGIYLMAMAGYDPREAPIFWERMKTMSEGQQKPPEYLSTHPDDDARIAAISAKLDKAMEYYNASEKAVKTVTTKSTKAK